MGLVKPYVLNLTIQIAVMKKELQALQPQLVEAARVTQTMMATIEKESAAVEKKSEMVREDEAIAHQQAEEATSLKAECMTDLAEALPQLDSMREYFSNIVIPCPLYTEFTVLHNRKILFPLVYVMLKIPFSRNVHNVHRLGYSQSTSECKVYFIL